ncbi:DUF3800 domain-containing protein [Cupriavidus sp. D39]|uniref:DUF3800 domain-containing protein n=1 Tax=Cupriavidus sp. D39 TaxID=2997877 RepID=UPI00226EA6D8|nr:DUF3800 domain-containing protein [Cupriavidus sp. D39]MCY0852509.1 DUF3800 domain-containing protein [Cupriavidus sp. D39]
MERFSIDESGYTGFDLLNSDQRFQGATAISASNEDAVRLIREHFPKLQASELKYRALARRPANRERLLKLQRDVLAQNKCVTYICDKRYLLLLMFVDYAVEPFYYEQGVNYYEDGRNYSLASLLYYVGPAILGEAEFSALLAAFQHAIKFKTPQTIHELVLAARRVRWNELPEALEPLACAAPECLAAIATPGVTTDAAFVVLQSLISRMEVMAEVDYRVEHDRSKNLLNYNALLERYIAHDHAIEFRQSSVASIKFPLKLSAVTQVDSKDSPAVQLADVLIGAAIEAANSLAGLRGSVSNPEEVLGLYADDQFIHMVPSLDFAEQKAFRRGTQAADVINYFAKNFHGPTS